VIVETEYKRKVDVDALDDYNEGKNDGYRHDIGNRKRDQLQAVEPIRNN
jgi:hypothetical protein